MICNVILVVSILYLIFAINDFDCRFRPTTTALQEIWSGGCARRCLHSHTYTIEDHNQQIQRDNTCCCDICRCGFFENAIRICNPTIISFHSIMSSINEMVQSVVQTVRATYDYFVEMVHGMLNQTQRSPEDVMVNITQISGSDHTVVVPKPDKTVVAKVKPTIPAKEKLKAESKKSNQSIKSQQKLSTNTSSSMMRDGNVMAALVPVVKTPSGPMGTIGPVATLASTPPAKHEVGTDAKKLTEETTSPKCTRCIEKNVFCNQDCPNTKTNNRVE